MYLLHLRGRRLLRPAPGEGSAGDLAVDTVSTLFDVGPAPTPAEPLSATQRLTIRNRDLLDRGVHPATRTALLDPKWGYTCNDCAHLRRWQYHNRTYVKCERHHLGESHSAASDVRVGWPACARFRIDAETP